MDSNPQNKKASELISADKGDSILSLRSYNFDHRYSSLIFILP